MSYETPKWPEGAYIKYHNWHFHKRLHERYNLILLPGEYTKILNQIRSGVLKPIFFWSEGGMNTYKYIHEKDTPNQRRIYIVATSDGFQLVSVSRPEWVYTKINLTRRLRNKAQRRRGLMLAT